MKILTALFRKKQKTLTPINRENLEAGNWKKGYCRDGGGFWQKTGVRYFIFSGRAQYTDNKHIWREEYPQSMEELEKCVYKHLNNTTYENI